VSNDGSPYLEGDDIVFHLTLPVKADNIKIDFRSNQAAQIGELRLFYICGQTLL